MTNTAIYVRYEPINLLPAASISSLRMFGYAISPYLYGPYPLYSGYIVLSYPSEMH